MSQTTRQRLFVTSACLTGVKSKEWQTSSEDVQIQETSEDDSCLHSLQQVQMSKVTNENRFLQTDTSTAVSHHNEQTCCHEEAKNEKQIWCRSLHLDTFRQADTSLVFLIICFCSNTSD